MKSISSKWIRFSDNSIKSCIGFIDLVDSTKTTITMNNSMNMRNYYSLFINSISDLVKNYNGKIIKILVIVCYSIFQKLLIHLVLVPLEKLLNVALKL
jgi:hypothetical protein